MSYLPLATLLTSFPAAQVAEPLLLTGDVVPVAGQVTAVGRPEVNSSGQWLVDAQAFAGEALVDSDGPFYVAGEALNLPAGIEAVRLTTHWLTDSDARISVVQTGPFLADSVLVFDSELVVRVGDSINAPSLPASTGYALLHDAVGNANDQILIATRTDRADVPTGQRNALVVIDTVDGVPQGTRSVVHGGDVLAGQTSPVTGLPDTRNTMAINGLGSVLFSAGLADGTGVVYRDSTLVAQTGAASPYAGVDWRHVGFGVDLNALGEFVYIGVLDNPTQDAAISKDNQPFVRVGDSLAAIAPFALNNVVLGPVHLTDAGQVVWAGRWDDPADPTPYGIFVDHRLVVDPGVTTTTDGRVIRDINTFFDRGYAVSNDGRHLVFDGRLDGGVRGAFRIDVRAPLGAPYCTSVAANSTGEAATIAGFGDARVVRNDVTLSAESLPPFTLGIFLVSDTQGFVANPGGSQGNLCLAGSIGRYQQSVVSSGSLGRFELELDLASIPAPMGFVAAQPGETWNFQAWYRDANPAATSNFTGGLAITFE